MYACLKKNNKKKQQHDNTDCLFIFIMKDICALQ